jgi:hypothetical protein
LRKGRDDTGYNNYPKKIKIKHRRLL